jgi:outer membrane protein assembly factor BamD
VKKLILAVLTIFIITSYMGCSKKNTRVLLGEEEYLLRLNQLYEKKDFSDFQEEARYFLSDFPGSRKGPWIQYLIGEAYAKKKQYEEAIVAYQRVIDKYPESEYLDDAFFKIGEAYYKQKRKPQRDQEPTQRAIYYFQKVTEMDSPYQETARERIADCRNTLAMKEYYIARFYFKREEYKISLAVIENALKEYGDITGGNWLRYLQIRDYLELGEKDKAFSLYSFLLQQDIQDKDLAEKIKDIGESFQADQ